MCWEVLIAGSLGSDTVREMPSWDLGIRRRQRIRNSRCPTFASLGPLVGGQFVYVKTRQTVLVDVGTFDVDSEFVIPWLQRQFNMASTVLSELAGECGIHHFSVDAYLFDLPEDADP